MRAMERDGTVGMEFGCALFCRVAIVGGRESTARARRRLGD